MDVDLILKVASEQEKTIDNCFFHRECAETRSSEPEACLGVNTTMFQEGETKVKYGC